VARFPRTRAAAVGEPRAVHRRRGRQRPGRARIAPLVARKAVKRTDQRRHDYERPRRSVVGSAPSSCGQLRARQWRASMRITRRRAGVANPRGALFRAFRPFGGPTPTRRTGSLRAAVIAPCVIASTTIGWPPRRRFRIGGTSLEIGEMQVWLVMRVRSRFRATTRTPSGSLTPGGASPLPVISGPVRRSGRGRRGGPGGTVARALAG
jgi:hypothetical protein